MVNVSWVGAFHYHILKGARRSHVPEEYMVPLIVKSRFIGFLELATIIYAEVSVGFQRIEKLEAAIATCGARLLQVPKEALLLAAKAFVEYRKRKGFKRSPLANEDCVHHTLDFDEAGP